LKYAVEIYPKAFVTILRGTLNIQDFYEDQTTNYIRSVGLSDVIAGPAKQIAHREWIPMHSKRVTVSLEYLIDKLLSITSPLRAPIRIILIQIQPIKVI